MPRKNLRRKSPGFSNDLLPNTSARFFNHSASLNAFAKDLFLGKFNKVIECNDFDALILESRCPDWKV